LYNSIDIEINYRIQINLKHFCAWLYMSWKPQSQKDSVHCIVSSMWFCKISHQLVCQILNWNLACDTQFGYAPSKDSLQREEVTFHLFSFSFFNGESICKLLFIIIFQQWIYLAYYEPCKIILTSRTLLFSEVYTTLNCSWLPRRNKNYFKGVKSLYILWLSKELKWASELEWCCSTRHWDISYTYIVSSAMKMKTSWIFQNLLGLEEKNNWEEILFRAPQRFLHYFVC